MGLARIELNKVQFDDEVERGVLAVLRSGQVAQGPVVACFERALATAAGSRHAVAVSNGTASLIAAMTVAGIGPGHEVITSPFTFVATVNAILAVGATPVFGDIDPLTFTLCPASVDGLMTDNTRAVMPVHLFGQAADMNSLVAVAERHDAIVIQDAAQALGAEHSGRPLGSFGMASYSFYATKNVTTGEGGAVTTDDDGLGARLRQFRNQGMSSPGVHSAFGLNLRMTDLQAAVGLPQMGGLLDISERRAHNAAVLTAGLNGIEGLTLPAVRAGDRHVFHHYTVRVGAGARVDRDGLQAGLVAAGIGSGVYYRHLAFDQPCHGLVAAPAMPCAHASAATREVLSLPVHQHLSESDLARIIDAVRAILV